MEQQVPLVPGANVYGADGEKVGTVSTWGSTFLVVAKGFFFPTDYYIPMSAVESSTNDEIYLNVTKEEALTQGWDIEPPTEGEYAGTHTGDYVDETNLRVPVHEEHLEATKRVADAREVTISKRVVTEQETIEVPVTEERVRVDWRTASGEASGDEAVFEEGSIEVPVSREVVDVSKRTVRTGELEVTKEREQRTEQVTDSVRREVVDVDDTSVRAKQGRQDR